jgi:hypothetical protein
MGDDRGFRLDFFGYFLGDAKKNKAEQQPTPDSINLTYLYKMNAFTLFFKKRGSSPFFLAFR